VNPTRKAMHIAIFLFCFVFSQLVFNFSPSIT
jgi:hypothetical protein